MNKNLWQEISRLYYAALDQPESKRKSFLNSCKDENLRRQVISLLSDDSLAKSFLEAPALDAVSRMKAEEQSSLQGRQLGSFFLVSELGSGGMGEVYLAKDLKLGRDVAIKVLPEEFAHDRDRVARFHREAKLLASLNHPNIAAIHNLEESDGTNFIVMELVEGTTLDDRIKSGPIPVEEALKLALQIAEALEAAHEKGVIHRDLKPANIKVTPDGKVKILDFGLAKAFSGEPEYPNAAHSPVTSPTTSQEGGILGTASYMSPEQAQGKTADKRADIWAFGVVLFEMLTGKQPFTGETVQETLNAVIKREPEWSGLPPDIHSRIRLVLERCLQKDPKKRYGRMNDARADIVEALAELEGHAQPIAKTEPKAKPRQMLAWASITAILLIVSGMIIWNIRSRGVKKHVYDLPENQQFASFFVPDLAVSPNGSQIVYSTQEGLYSISVDEMEDNQKAKIISGAERNALGPFFLPDGKEIAYATGNRLKKIAIGGGTPELLMEFAPIGIDWGKDGTIVYTQLGKNIMRISDKGGNPQPLVEKLASEELFFTPQMLPGGEAVLFTRYRPFPPKVMVQSIPSGEPKELFIGDTARYIPTGHIVYRRENTIYAIPFDPGKLEVTGAEVTMVEGVIADPSPQFAVSDSGTLVYMPGTLRGINAPHSTVVRVDRNGKEETLLSKPDVYSHPQISPDGKKVALTKGADTNKSDIYIWDMVGKKWITFTSDPVSDPVPNPATDIFPLWTPKGKWIVFTSWRSIGARLYRKPVDDEGEAEPLGSDYGQELVPLASSWSEDKKTLVFTDFTAGENFNCDIETLSMDGEGKFKALLKTDNNEMEPKISPDGRWMAYTSDKTDKYEVYVRPFPEAGSAEPWKISTGGGSSPLWSPNSRELFYRNGNAVMAVSVTTGRNFSYGSPETLFTGDFLSSNDTATLNDSPDVMKYLHYLNSWDIGPDGRFIMLKKAEASSKAPRQIIVLENWFESLKQRAPVY